MTEATNCDQEEAIFSDFIPRNLSELQESDLNDKYEYVEWERTRIIDKPPGCQRLRIIGNETWFVTTETNTMNVYSKDGDKLRDVTFENIGFCRAVVKVQSQLVLAASKGLFISDMDGVILSTLVEGDFSDVANFSNIICALDGQSAIVTVLKLNPETPLQEPQVLTEIFITETDYDASENLNTIQMTSDSIYVCIYYEHVILQYTHSGSFVAKYGSKGRGPENLYWPKLCGADKQGTLLIADEDNSCFKTLTADGQWGKMLRPCEITTPLDAVMDGEMRLTVVRWMHDMKQFRLEFE